MSWMKTISIEKEYKKKLPSDDMEDICGSQNILNFNEAHN